MSKQCPLCKFRIPSDAVICGHCGASMSVEDDQSFLGKLNAAVKGFMTGVGISLVLAIVLVNVLPSQSWFSVIVFGICVIVPPILLTREYWINGSTSERWTSK